MGKKKGENNEPCPCWETEAHQGGGVGVVQGVQQKRGQKNKKALMMAVHKGKGWAAGLQPTQGAAAREGELNDG